MLNFACLYSFFSDEKVPWSRVLNPWPWSAKLLAIQREESVVLQSSFQVWAAAPEWIWSELKLKKNKYSHVTSQHKHWLIKKVRRENNSVVAKGSVYSGFYRQQQYQLWALNKWGFACYLYYLLNESMTRVTFISIVLYASLTLKTFYIVKLSASSQSCHFVLMLIWIAELKCTWVCLCVHICVLCPQGPAVLGHWCKQFWLVKACWEALIQFQQHVLLHQLDNEGQQCGCTFEISFLSTSELVLRLQTCSLWSLGWHLYSFKSIQFQQCDADNMR